MSAASRPSSATRHKNQILTVQESPRSSVLHGSRSFGRRRRLLIIKFGGSSLSNPKRIGLAVASVAREYTRGSRVVVVVSAVGNTTNRLLHLTNGGAGLVETDRDDILAMALEADEVVLVTNVPGILSADPALVRNAQVLPRIDMKTLTGIADTGTKFIHRKALRFKDPNINIRVISNTNGRLDSLGTLVTGASIPELEVTINNPHQ